MQNVEYSYGSVYYVFSVSQSTWNAKYYKTRLFQFIPIMFTNDCNYHVELVKRLIKINHDEVFMTFTQKRWLKWNGGGRAKMAEIPRNKSKDETVTNIQKFLE